MVLILVSFVVAVYFIVGISELIGKQSVFILVSRKGQSKLILLLSVVISFTRDLDNTVLFLIRVIALDISSYRVI